MKALAAILFSTAALMAQKPMTGDWEGTLDANGAKLRLALHIKDAGGKLSATLDSLDQGAFGIGVDRITAAGGKLEFSIDQINGSYKGTYAEDAAEVKGEWSQNGATLPLDLKRGSGKAAIPAKPLSAEDRDFAAKHLEKTRAEFLAEIRGLTPQQWSYKPASGGWSIAECAEHITVSEDFLPQFAKNLLKAPANADASSRTREMDEKVIAAYADRSKKAQAPEPLRPGNAKLATPADAVTAFNSKRDRNIEYVRTTSDDLRQHTMNSPVGTIDAYELLLGMSAHSARHTAQIREVKADSGYPK